jgi:TonB family protein
MRTVRQPAPKPVAPVDPNQIARRITSRVPTVTISAPAPAANVTAAETARTKEYYDAVGALLYQRWQQPSRAEAGNSTPTVTVEFHVFADGTVTRARITRTSGAVAMDGSVETLLKHVGRLPAFSGYRITAASLTFSVDFKLD